MLTDTRIQDHNGLVGLYGLANLHHLLKELGLLFMSTRRIHNDDIETLFLELGNTLRCNGNGICLRV